MLVQISIWLTLVLDSVDIRCFFSGEFDPEVVADDVSTGVFTLTIGGVLISDGGKACPVGEYSAMVERASTISSSFNRSPKPFDSCSALMRVSGSISRTFSIIFNKPVNITPELPCRRG